MDDVTPHLSPPGLTSVFEHQVGDRRLRVISGRALHASLGIGKDVTTWLSDRIAERDLVRDADYVEIVLPSAGVGGVGRPGRDVYLSFYAAKRIALVQRNAIGSRVRDHFIVAEEAFHLADLARSEEARAALLRDLAEMRASAAAAESRAAEAESRASTSDLPTSYALLQRRLAVSDALLRAREAEDDYLAECDRRGVDPYSEPFLGGPERAVTRAHGAGHRSGLGHRSGPSSVGGSPPRATRSPRGPIPVDIAPREAASDVPGESAASPGLSDDADGDVPARVRSRRHAGGRCHVPLVAECARRAGLEIVAYTGYGALAPGGTTARDAVSRLLWSWGMDDAVVILGALARSPHRLARTTMVIRPMAELARHWPDLARLPGAPDAIAGLDFQSIDDELRREGSVFVLARFAGFRAMIERGLGGARGQPVAPRLDAWPGPGLVPGRPHAPMRDPRSALPHPRMPGRRLAGNAVACRVPGGVSWPVGPLGSDPRTPAGVRHADIPPPRP